MKPFYLYIPFLLLTLTVPARADETATELETVTITATPENPAGPVEGYVATRGSTGTKTNTPLKEIPQSISVITADQIKDQAAENMQQVLRYTAGVRAEMYGMDNRGDWFSMRGGSEGSTLLDGMRLPLTGYYGVMRNEPFAFDRIEVLRGPSSVMAGQNGPGGVVNLVSKLPQADAKNEINIQYGSFDHKQFAADVGGQINDNVLYRLVMLEKDSGTQIEYADENRSYVAPSLKFKLNEATELTTYIQYQKDESGNTNAFFPIAGTLEPGPNGHHIPDQTFIGEPDWDTYGGERFRYGYQFQHQLNDAWTLKHNLRHDDVDGQQYSMYAAWWEGYLLDNQSLNRIWYASRDEARITNADFLAEGKLQLGNTEHTLLLGVDTMWSDTEQWLSDGGYATPLDVYDPVYGTFPKPAWNFGPSTVTEVDQTGYILQDQIKFDQRWVLTAGLRYDQAESDIDGASVVDDSELTSRVGLVYLADNGFAPYISYSESFEPIADVDRNGQPFKPKSGEQIEIGTRWSPASELITLSAAVYSLVEQNRLTPDPVDPNFSAQLGEVGVDGLELEALVNLSGWDLTANYTYTDAEVTEGNIADGDIYVGHKLTSIPRHSAAAWAAHKFSLADMPGFRAGLGVRYVGSTWDGIDVVKTPSNTLFDALFSFEQQQWTLALNATNLLDEEYIVTCLDRGDCWFGNRRKVVGSVSYKF